MPAVALALSSGIGKRKRHCTRNNLCHVQYMKPRERVRGNHWSERFGEREERGFRPCSVPKNLHPKTSYLIFKILKIHF